MHAVSAVLECKGLERSTGQPRSCRCGCEWGCGLGEGTGGVGGGGAEEMRLVWEDGATW